MASSVAAGYDVGVYYARELMSDQESLSNSMLVVEEEPTLVLEIRKQHRYHLLLQLTDEESDHTSLQLCYPFDIPPHVLGNPCLQQDFIFDALKTAQIDELAWEDVILKIQAAASAIDEASSHEGSDLVLVVEIDVTLTQVVMCDQQENKIAE